MTPLLKELQKPNFIRNLFSHRELRFARYGPRTPAPTPRLVMDDSTGEKVRKAKVVGKS